MLVVQSYPTLRPHGLRPARLLCPWDSPGKNAEVGCHFLLQGIFPTQGIEPASLMSPALAGGFFTNSTIWEAQFHGVARSRTRLSDFTFTFHFHALEKEMATHSCSCLENPRDGGAWWAAIYGVAQSWTRLKRLSSSSSSSTA